MITKIYIKNPDESYSFVAAFSQNPHIISDSGWVDEIDDYFRGQGYYVVVVNGVEILPEITKDNAIYQQLERVNKFRNK